MAHGIYYFTNLVNWEDQGYYRIYSPERETENFRDVMEVKIVKV